MSSSLFDFHENRISWAQFLKQIRSFFETQKYTEVSTPLIVPVGAFESTIDTLKVSSASGLAELHSSPEIAMKTILADFPHAIYQICKSFRDDPESPHHAKEFTMLEFYKPNTLYSYIEKETLALFQCLSPKPIPSVSFSIYELINQLTKIDLECNQSQESLMQALKSQTDLHVSKEDSWADLFFKIMIDIVEPALPKNTFCLLNQYPAAVSPLSQPIQGSSKAQRFEIYWNQIELCNGCTELSDEKLLRNRYLVESKERIAAGKTPHPEPTHLFHSASKMGGVSGVAVGLERLFFAMECTKKL